MNKIIPIISFLVLLTYSLLGQTVVSIPNVTSPTGQEVLVPINATVTDLGSVNINVKYDSSVLTFVEVANNNLIGGSFVINPHGDTLSIAWFNTTSVDIASKILDLKFIYNGGTSAVSFVGTNQLADSLSTPINSVFTDGSVGPEPISIDLSDVTGVPGDTVEVEMTAVNLENIGAMNLYINYDDSKATFLEMGSINLANFTANGVPDRVNLGMFDANGFNHSSGVLATLKFVVIAGNTNLDFDGTSFVQDVNFVNLPVGLTGGSVGEVDATMSLGNVSAVAGTEVVIPLSALKLTNIGSFNMDVLYNPAVLEFVRVENVVSGSLVGNEVAGVLSLGYFNANGLDLLDGNIADLVFNYLGGNSNIMFDVATASILDLNFAPVLLDFVNGSVSEIIVPSFVTTLPDTTIEVNTTLSFLYTGSHPSGIDLTFSLVSGPGGVAIDTAGQFSWVPVSGQAGTYDIIAGLSDGTAMVYDTATVTVTDGEVFLYEIEEKATDGNLDNVWYQHPGTGAGSIVVADSTGSAWGSHVIVASDSGYTGLFHPKMLALSNYTIEADIYVIGPNDADAPLYAGLAIRMEGSKFEFYRFVYRNSSSNNGQLRLQGYDGSWHINQKWNPGVDFPALETGWHNFKVRVHDGEFQCFINGQLLPGGPYVDPNPFLAKGYPGIYKYDGGYNQVVFDNFKVQATSVPEQKIVSIKEIQSESDVTDYLGLAIKTTAIVTASDNDKRYFLQDSTGAWNGIFVFDRANQPAIGDEVTLTAFVDEFHGKTQLLDIVEFNVNSSNNTLPDPVVITAAQFGEAYEGVLITVENGIVTDPDLGWGEWELSDTSGSTRVDDVFYKSTPDSGALVSVTGVGDFSFSNYKILPRDSSDVVFHAESVIALDHNTGNLVVSVFNNGTIGANRFDGVNYGSGVVWKTANGIWRGGPVFGTAARASVNGQANNNNPANFFDLTNVSSNFTSGFYAETVGTVDFDQVSDAVFSDGLSNNPYGLDITQKTYSKTNEDVVYIQYTFANNTGADVLSFSAGIFMDYDATPYLTNNGGYALSENLAYVYADGTTGPHFGVATLDTLHGARVTAANAPSIDALRTDGYGFITTLDPTDPGTGDQRLWVGTYLGDIPDGESKTTTFAILAGDDLQNIRANAENAFILGKLAGLTNIIVGVDGDPVEIPMNFEISQNYPNPFNPATTIQYALPLQSSVKISVYNTLGQLVTKLVDADLNAGYHQVQFNASNLASGVYFYSIQAEAIDGSKNFQIVKKMMLVK